MTRGRVAHERAHRRAASSAPPAAWPPRHARSHRLAWPQVWHGCGVSLAGSRVEVRVRDGPRPGARSRRRSRGWRDRPAEPAAAPMAKEPAYQSGLSRLGRAAEFRQARLAPGQVIGLGARGLLEQCARAPGARRRTPGRGRAPGRRSRRVVDAHECGGCAALGLRQGGCGRGCRGGPLAPGRREDGAQAAVERRR